MAGSGRSRREWGWHRLTDEWAARAVASAGVRPGELVLDIGAGHGALTAHLVQAGARVVAVELNPQRAGVLRERFPGITVVQADATCIPLPGRPFRVVANPPYGISSPLLRKLLAPGSRLSAADFVLQRGGAQIRRHRHAEIHPRGRPCLAATRLSTAPARRLCSAGDPPPEMSSFW